ncbi:MAG: ComEA family DNA-binding protein [Pelovirga sp.]
MKTMRKALVACLFLLVVGGFGQSAIAFEKINLNTATVEQLTSLTGIGPVTAQKIDEYRQANRFASIDELKNVKGIGDKTLEKLRDQLTVETTN